MKKIFLLQNLEQHLDETIFLEGDNLVDQEKIRWLKELEKHLWVAEVEDGRLVEVEIKISPSKVLAYTCECNRYEAEGICQHIAAVLIKIRRKKISAKAESKLATKKKRVHKKLTTNSILEQVAPEDLQAFVRHYAKSNRSFAIALKARFASQVASVDTKEKFSQLLESAINHNRKPDRSISLRGSQKIVKVLAEIQAQIEDEIAKEHFSEAISMAQSIIEKVSSILKKLGNNQEIIFDHVLEAFEAFSTIVAQQPAPALKESIWSYCLEESDKIIYRANQIDLQFYKILLKLIDSDQKAELLLQRVDEQILKYKKENRPLSEILLTKITLLEKTGHQKEVKRLIEENINEPDILFFAIGKAIKLKDFSKAKILATEGLKIDKLKYDQFRLKKILLQIAREENDSKAIVHYAEDIFLKILEISYYKLLKAHFTGDLDIFRSDLVEKIEKKPFSEKRRDIIAAIYQEDEQWPSLLNYLQKTQSIDLVLQFDEALFPDYRRELAALYRDLLRQYLQNHLGRKTSQRVRECIHHLKNIGIAGLADELVQEFRENYPERHTLMEELAYF